MITVGKSTCFYRLSQVDPEVAYLAKSRYKSTRLTRPIGDVSIPPTTSTRNCGVIFDSQDAQVGKVFKMAISGHIRRVRSRLSPRATSQVVQSNLDYCNLLLQ